MAEGTLCPPGMKNNCPPGSDSSMTPKGGSVNDSPTRDKPAPTPKSLGGRTA